MQRGRAEPCANRSAEPLQVGGPRDLAVQRRRTQGTGQPGELLVEFGRPGTGGASRHSGSLAPNDCMIHAYILRLRVMEIAEAIAPLARMLQTDGADLVLVVAD